MVAAWQASADWRRTPGGRRVVSFALAVGVHLLLLLLLLRLSPDIIKRPPPGGPTTIFTVPAPSPAPQAAAKASRKQEKAVRTTAATAPAPVPPPTRAAQNTVAQPWVINPDLAGFSLQPGTSREKVAAADTPASGELSGGQSGSGGKSVGRGPGGQTLYAAQWVREPTDAEMAPYMPRGSFIGGWADIACRTVDRFRVEDCEELGQSPPGSGLSRALREASFQFLVRPPRINGKAMVGEWVRIHFDFIERKPAG